MKKRLLCIFMIIVMIVPFVLASCGESEEDKMKEIILGGGENKIDRALTLSIWLPTEVIDIDGKTADLGDLSQKDQIKLSNEYPEVYDFLKRVDAVEDAINKELIGRNYYTNIDIVPVSNDYYEQAIADRFEQMDANSDPFNMNARGDSDEYANEVVEETVGTSTLYNLLYRPVDDNQLDIFLIRDYGEYSGYELYREYIDKGYLLPLDKTTDGNGETDLFPKTNYITSSGTYASINKLIRQNFLSQMKVGDYTYALPCNHLYTEQQFFAINKKVFEKYADSFKVSDFSDFSVLASYIEAVAAGENDITPLFAQGLLPAFGLVDLDNLTYGDEAANSVLNDEAFVEFVKAYKQLESKGLLADTLAENEIAAVKLVDGNSVEELNEINKDYYLVPVGESSIDSSEMYSSMFAISTFTLDYDRSMKILNLLVSDSKIVTMLQYGIKNEDYSVTTEVRDGEEVEVLKLGKDSAYKMNNLYTGSSYYTYPHADATIDQWDAVKKANLNIVVSKYINADYFLNKNTLSQAELDLLNMKSELKELAIKAFEEINAMSYDEFVSFIDSESLDYASVIVKYENAYNFVSSADYDSVIALYAKYVK